MASKTDGRKEQWVLTLVIPVFFENLACAMLNERVLLFLSHINVVSSTDKQPLECYLDEAYFHSILDTWTSNIYEVFE